MILDGPWQKIEYYARRNQLQQRGTPMSICFYGFSMHEILKIKLSTLSLLRKNKSTVARPFE